jgi:GNAT superfamily N-acetyltransferase
MAEKFHTLVRSTRIEPLLGFLLPHEVVVRTIRPDDVNRIGALLHYGFRDSIHTLRFPGVREGISEAQYCFNKSDVIFHASYVATFDGDAVCATVVNNYRGLPWLFYCCTDPTFRAFGLATFLITQSLRSLHSKGHIDMYLNVAQRNESAGRLYRKMGFERPSQHIKAVK